MPIDELGLVERLRADIESVYAMNATAPTAGDLAWIRSMKAQLVDHLTEAAAAIERLLAERDDARKHAETLLRTAQEDFVLMKETAATVTSLRERAEAAEARGAVLTHGGYSCIPSHAVEIAHMVSSAEAAMASREHHDHEVLDLLRDYLKGAASVETVIVDYHENWPKAFTGVARQALEDKP